MNSSESEDQDVNIEEEELSKPIILAQATKGMEIQENSDPFNGTFVFFDEDHTLGNSLRYILANQPNVEFCGYSLPHPSENKMNMRLQTVNETKEKVMNDGLKCLSQICDIIEDKFKQALEKK
ncbi:unnamed protein product [Paramecium octaurelia]|uniref:DNA-directed RNA polymerase RBP11-like dimerisation domain-containing protein n=1 Tax=Paramecium octaurelia TaxID=43137 RepID=A0A8S1TYP0_PAROT|nr:unnamed protein product [Paramecium octaurelia]